MPLTAEILTDWYTTMRLMPRDPFNDADDVDEQVFKTDLYEYINRDCPTNLAMLDVFCQKLAQDIPCVLAVVRAMPLHALTINIAMPQVL